MGALSAQEARDKGGSTERAKAGQWAPSRPAGSSPFLASHHHRREHVTCKSIVTPGFLKENRMHNYMYVRIKFHTYSDVIMAK